MNSGEMLSSAVTTTVLASTFVSTLETPSILPRMRFTALAHPSLEDDDVWSSATGGGVWNLKAERGGQQRSSGGGESQELGC
mmetsp:Transcript_34928/g.104188  ORF Transcript_34928/g.104188 Transcript_34928/m.104188 type:complete len:82 (-) Transcript_34928:427-672(-)